MISVAHTPFESRPINLILFSVVSIISILYVWIGFEMQANPTGYHSLYLLMLLQLTPFAISFCRQDYDYIGFILFNHFFTYSIAKYNQLYSTLKLEHLYPQAINAIHELTICTVITMLGYYTVRFTFFTQPKKKEKFQLLSLERWQLIIVACYVIFVPVFLNWLPSWFLVLHFTTMGADMMLLLCSNSPGNERLSFVLRLGVFLSTVWYFLTTGALSMVGALAAYVFVAACIRRNYRLLIFPLALTLVGSLIQNVKVQYRMALKESPSMSTGERFELLGSMLALEYMADGKMEVDDTQVGKEDEKEIEDKFLSGFARVGDDSLEKVLAWTPSKVPFWEGETYAHIPFMFIPRILWPDKPSRHIWNRFGRSYGYLGADDFETSVGVSYLAEAYMNFGTSWMYCVAFLFGVFAMLVESISYKIFRGHFSFTFLVFLIPLQWYAADIGSILNSIFITVVALNIFRTQFLKMARKDEYS